MAKALLIEDQKAAAERLEQILQDTNPGIEVLSCQGSIKSAVNWLRKNPSPDLILLDLRLSNGHTFGIFEQVQIDCPVIFVAGYSETGIRAFRVNAVDYPFKPLSGQDNPGSPGHAKDLQAIPDFTDALPPAHPNYISRILIRFGQTIRLVETSDIAYFYTRDKLTFLMTQSTGKRIPVDYSLDKLEQILDPQLFFRINRQIIVRVNAIHEMFPGPKSRIVLSLAPSLDQEAVVSSERSASFKRWLVGEGAH